MSGQTNTNLELVNTEKLQLVVVVRFQPSDKAMAAGSMVDNVASGVKGAADAVDKALSYVPGVLEEQKSQEQPLDDGFCYHETYPDHWDKVLKETEETLKEMNDNNECIIFEYDSYGQADKHIALLEAKLKSTIAPLKDELYGIHFVGLSEGGHIAISVAKKIAGNLGAHGSIDSIFCVGTALYGEEDTKDFLQRIPNVINYKSTFDLSAHAVQYAKNPDALIEAIKLVNQTPVKYVYSMLVAKITKILTQLLNGLTLNTSSGIDPLKNLIHSLKNDIQSIIEDLFKFAKHLIGSFKSFLSLPQIDQKLDQVFGNPGGVAADSADRLMQFVKSFKDMLKMGGQVGMDTDRLNFGRLFNFMVPPVLLIDDALNAITIDLENNEPANHLTDFTKKDAFYQPITHFDKQMATRDPYQEVVLESARNNDFDQLTVMIATVQQGVVTLGNPKTDDRKREEIGVSLSRSLMLPMLSRKTELLGLLMKKLPSLGNNPALNKIKSDTVTEPLLGLLRKIKGDTDFDDTDTGNDKELGLKKALARLDGSISKIKAILKPNYFKIDKKYNSLHFIYNSHNVALAQMPKELRKSLDKATHIYQTKLAQGFEYNELDGSYKPGKDGVKTDPILVVAEAEDAA